MVKRLIFWFATSGYFLTFLYYYGPLGIGYSRVLHGMLPFWMCILALGGMPVQAVALVIAPINALSYGIVGAFMGVIASTIKQWPRSDATENSHRDFLFFW